MLSVKNALFAVALTLVTTLPSSAQTGKLKRDISKGKPASESNCSGANTQGAEEIEREIVKSYQTGQSHGLKITIYLSDETNSLKPVDPKEDFHQDEKFKILLESNFKGHVYITNLGSGGNTTLLFPDPQERENEVDRGYSYLIPKSYKFQFTGATGIEVFQVFLAQKPIAFFEKAVEAPEGRIAKNAYLAQLKKWNIDFCAPESGVIANNQPPKTQRGYRGAPLTRHWGVWVKEEKASLFTIRRRRNKNNKILPQEIIAISINLKHKAAQK